MMIRTAAEYAALALSMRQRADDYQRRAELAATSLRAAYLVTADSFRRMADAAAQDARRVAA